jgi:hypothetical protein
MHYVARFARQSAFVFSDLFSVARLTLRFRWLRTEVCNVAVAASAHYARVAVDTLIVLSNNFWIRNGIAISVAGDTVFVPHIVWVLIGSKGK